MYSQQPTLISKKVTIQLTKDQLRRLFGANYGASAKLARQLSISRSTVSRFLKGLIVSSRLEKAAATMAQDLLSQNHTLSISNEQTLEIAETKSS